MSSNLTLAVLGLLSLATPAFAHEGGVHVKGTVKTVSSESLTIRTGTGEETLRLASETRFICNSAAAKAGDVHAGDRVVVHARKKPGGLEAVEVKAASQRPTAR